MCRRPTFLSETISNDFACPVQNKRPQPGEYIRLDVPFAFCPAGAYKVGNPIGNLVQLEAENCFMAIHEAFLEGCEIISAEEALPLRVRAKQIEERIAEIDRED